MKDRIVKDIMVCVLSQPQCILGFLHCRVMTFNTKLIIILFLCYNKWKIIYRKAGVIMINQLEIERVAKLARLKCTEKEVQQYTHQLGSILEYINTLNQIDTTDVEPTVQVISLKNVYREDKVQQSLDKEAIFANAPEREESYFKTPKILGR